MVLARLTCVRLYCRNGGCALLDALWYCCLWHWSLAAFCFLISHLIYVCIYRCICRGVTHLMVPTNDHDSCHGKAKATKCQPGRNQVSLPYQRCHQGLSWHPFRSRCRYSTGFHSNDTSYDTEAKAERSGSVGKSIHHRRRTQSHPCGANHIRGSEEVPLE